MQSEQGFSSLIYDYFVTRIQFQYYKEGDQLPSIDALCHEFCVADQTVRAALRRMRAEGYISMHNGQPTKVIFHQSEKRYTDFVIQFYKERQSAMVDLFQWSNLVFTPMLAEVFLHIGQEDFAFLKDYVQKADYYDLLHFYNYVLQHLNNSLLMNLFWEVILFIGFPFLKTTGKQDLCNIIIVRERLLRTMDCGKLQDADYFNREYPVFTKYLYSNVINHFKLNTHSDSVDVQIPFTWRIYRDHPQICYSLASQLLHSIYLGRYCDLQYLPSYEKMAKTFGVSLSTMRRTIRVLNHLGAVRTINGKGTLIFKMGEQTDPPNLKDPIVRRNLAYFFQAFEIMIFSCAEITKSTVSNMSGEKRRKLLQSLKQNIDKGRYDQTLWYLILCITHCSPMKGVREVYTKLYDLFLWGYPLKAYKGYTFYLDREEIRFTSAFVHALEINSVSLCASAVHEFTVKVFALTEKMLLSVGLQSDELRISPTIQLLPLKNQQNE